jgi:hypothetical protein
MRGVLVNFLGWHQGPTRQGQCLSERVQPAMLVLAVRHFVAVQHFEHVQGLQLAVAGRPLLTGAFAHVRSCAFGILCQVVNDDAA